jgi:hypothetical protein
MQFLLEAYDAPKAVAGINLIVPRRLFFDAQQRIAIA